MQISKNPNLKNRIYQDPVSRWWVIRAYNSDGSLYTNQRDSWSMAVIVFFNWLKLVRK